jgi:hypothetical protein
MIPFLKLVAPEITAIFRNLDRIEGKLDEILKRDLKSSMLTGGYKPIDTNIKRPVKLKKKSEFKGPFDVC